MGSDHLHPTHPEDTRQVSVQDANPGCELCGGRGWFVTRCTHRWLGPGRGYEDGLPPRAVGCWACLPGEFVTVDRPVPHDADTSTARAYGARMVVTRRP